MLNRIATVFMLLGCCASLAGALPVTPPIEARAENPQDLVTVRGVVFDAAGNPVTGATVSGEDGATVVSGADGSFALPLPPGTRRVVVTSPSHLTLVRTVEVVAGMELTLQFEQALVVRETVAVIGIRADTAVPITTANLDRPQLAALSYGQDAPQLLQYTPSMNWYSDSGTGSNYSYFNLRGIQQSRINMTYDGAPLNDPAEHALYFNNFHDFLSEVDSVQIQRGVGTSTVGTPAFGGSVNFASRPPRQRSALDGRLEFGSYDTTRASLGAHSGSFGNGFWLSGRYSYASTDGYRDHSGTLHGTGFLSAGWMGAKTSLKFTGFAGHEESQLAWLAVDPDTLAQNRRFNPLDEEERDNFQQRFGQVRVLHELTDDWLLSGSLYYNGADGWFRLWDSPAQNDLLQFGIDQGFWGTMATATQSGPRHSVTMGAHYSDFQGDHTLDLADARLYANTGYKKTVNVFAKGEYRLGDWLVFGDLQLRWAEFRYEGDIDLGQVSWTFLDPKLGVRRSLSPTSSLYASIGRAQREPARLDMLLGEDNATAPHDLGAVRPESVVNVELGYNLNTPRLALQANLYAMEFRDEIALTGELSAIGLPVRTNVDESYRRGLEVDLRWRFNAEWTLLHSLNLSSNRIANWTQYYDVYDTGGNWVGSEPTFYRDVRPLLTPEQIVNLGVEWARDTAAVAVMGRYVAESQLDNTGLAAFRTPSFTSVDVRASIGLGRWWPSGGPRLNLFVNNLFSNEDQLPSGYSYQFINRDDAGTDSRDGIPFYYPLATRNVIVAINFDL